MSKKVRFDCKSEDSFKEALAAHLKTSTINSPMNFDGVLEIPLFIAFQRGYSEIFREILADHKADTSICYNERGETILHRAVNLHKVSEVKALVENGADLNVKYNDLTPIMLAACSGAKKILDAFFKELGIDINAKDDQGYTHLHLAVMQGSPNAVANLIKIGADVEVRDNMGKTSFKLAFELGHFEIVAKLLPDHVINIINNKGETWLHMAAMRGDIKGVEALVAKGSDINLKDKGGYTPFMLAAQGRHFDIVAKLLPVHVINIINNKGETWLHMAAMHGDIKGVEALVAKGSDINLKDKGGCTPMMLAAQGGHFEIVARLVPDDQINNIYQEGQTFLHLAAKVGNIKGVEALVAKGADFNLKDKGGSTPMMLAALQGHSEIVGLLKEAGADIDYRSTHKQEPTFLHQAAFKGDFNLVKILIENNADFNLKDKGGRTPMILAAYRGHSEIVRLLKAAGADIDVRVDSEQDTLLHFAVIRKDVKLVKLLIANGADVNLKNKDGCTPMMLAIKQGHTVIVEALSLEEGGLVAVDEGVSAAGATSVVGESRGPLAGSKRKREADNSQQVEHPAERAVAAEEAAAAKVLFGLAAVPFLAEEFASDDVHDESGVKPLGVAEIIDLTGD